MKRGRGGEDMTWSEGEERRGKGERWKGGEEERKSSREERRGVKMMGEVRRRGRGGEEGMRRGR